MAKIIKLTESDLRRIVKKVIKEQTAANIGNAALAGATAGGYTGAGIGSIPAPGPGTAIGGIVGTVVGGLTGAAVAIANGTGTSNEKVKKYSDLCKSSKVQITANANQIADKIRDAVQGIGTDEQAIYSIFKANANPFLPIRTMDEFCSVVKAYESSYGVSLYDDLDDDIDSESEWVLIFRPLRDIALRDQQNQKSPKPTGGGARPTTGGAQSSGPRPTSPTSRMPVR